VAFDGRRVISERLGQDRNWGEFGELVQRAKSRGSCAEDLTKSVAEVTGVDVAAAGVAAEDPVAVGVRGCQIAKGLNGLGREFLHLTKLPWVDCR
jgi:hypothetical protein